ncbi:MAG: hypothetical protein E7321_06885 [Clostridiales bacterium]|nr:hypothetical protein [Clostridiales bacterium]
MSDKKNMRVIAADPLRFAMMARLCSKGTALLFAVLMVVFYVIAYKLCAAMEGAAVIAACGTLGAAILTAFAWRAVAREDAPVIVLLCLAALSMLAVGAHLAMLDIKPGRYTKVLEPLLGDMWNYELVTAAAWEDDGWSGVYLLILALLSRIETFSWLYALKLIDMICQCVAAGAVLRLALLRGAKVYGAIAAMFCAVLAPTMLMNAGVWAQCDATFAMFALWGLALLLSDHPMSGCVLWGLALGTKLQSAFLFPLLIVLFMKNRVQLRHVLALAASAFLCQIAIVLDGQGIMSMITRYAVQLENARWDLGLSDGMPNVYKLMVVASTREFSGMGLYLGIACAMLVVGALLRTKRELTNDVLLLGALLLACGLPLILPQMNARSLYLATMLGFACAGNARRMIAAFLIEFISLWAYMTGIFGYEVVPVTILALLAIGAAVLVMLELFEIIFVKKSEEAPCA